MNTKNIRTNAKVFGTLEATGNSTLGGSLGVAGATTIGGNLTVAGSISATSSSISFSYYYAADTLVVLNQPIEWDTMEFDTHSAVTDGTFEVPADEAGKYYIHGNMQTDTSAVISIYKNNSLFRVMHSVSTDPVAYGTTMNLLVGDTVDVRISAGAVVAGTSVYSTFQGFKIF